VAVDSSVRCVQNVTVVSRSYEEKEWIFLYALQIHNKNPKEKMGQI
jgi:hypothetical protein